MAPPAMAALEELTGCVKVLVQKGANVHAQDATGCKPIKLLQNMEPRSLCPVRVRTAPVCHPSPGPSPRMQNALGGGPPLQDAIPGALHRASSLGFKRYLEVLALQQKVVITFLSHRQK